MGDADCSPTLFPVVRSDRAYSELRIKHLLNGHKGHKKHKGGSAPFPYIQQSGRIAASSLIRFLCHLCILWLFPSCERVEGFDLRIKYV